MSRSSRALSRLMARKITIPRNTKNSGTSPICAHLDALRRLVFRRVAGFLSDGVDEPLAFVCVFDGQVEDALVVDLEKLC